MLRNWIWVIVAATLWTSSAIGNDKQKKETKPNNPPTQQPAAPKPVPQTPPPKPPVSQTPVQKPSVVEQPKQKPEHREEHKPGNAKPNVGNAIKENLINSNTPGIGNTPGVGIGSGNNPGKRPPNFGGGNSGQQFQPGNQEQYEHHHQGSNNNKPQTRDLIQLFLFSNSGLNRPYGYGGYGYGPRTGPGFGRPLYGSPQYVVPVIPQQQFQQQYQPGVDAPPPPRMVVPTQEQFGSLAMPHQRELLLHAINSLDDDLTRVGTGSQWKKHLQLAGLGESLTEVDGPLDAPEREKFRKHAEVFEGVAQEPAYRSIAGLWGFGTLRVGLREFAEEPIIKIRRAVAINAGWLSKAFEEVGTGSQWRTHLRLETLMARDDQGISAAEALDRFELVLTKFDRVQADPQYESVNELPGFQATHSALTDFVRELRLAATPPAPNQEAPTPAPEPPAPNKEE